MWAVEQRLCIPETLEPKEDCMISMTGKTKTNKGLGGWGMNERMNERKKQTNKGAVDSI